MCNLFFFYLASITLKPYTMKKLVFTAVALVTFSGFALANNKLDSVNEFNKIKSEQEVKVVSQTNEEDAWFCYEVSRTEKTNPISGETTITTVT